MSFQAMAWAVRIKLPTREKFVLLMLANYASNEHGECYPSVARLCDDTAMSRNTVLEAIKGLERAGVLSVVRRQQDGVNLPNVYRLRMEGSANGELPVQQAKEGSSNAALGGSAPNEPEPINVEPINQPKKSSGAAAIAFDGQRMTVSDDAMAGFLRAYPSIDVRAEIAKAEVWCQSNPARRPKSAYSRFLNAWLARAAARPTNARQTQLEQRQAFMSSLFRNHNPMGAFDADPRTIDHAP